MMWFSLVDLVDGVIDTLVIQWWHDCYGILVVSTWLRYHSYWLVVEHEQAIGELRCIVNGCGSVWTVEDRRESDCRLQRIWACVAKKNPSCSEAYTCYIIQWLHSHMGYSEPGPVHTRPALLTGHVPINRLISVEDCCLISVGAEGVS